MLNIIDEFTHECRACRIFLALTARRAWRSTLPSVVGGRPMILSAIAERLKPIMHRPSIPILGAAGIRNIAAISPAEAGRLEHSLPFARWAAPPVLLRPLAGPSGRIAHS